MAERAAAQQRRRNEGEGMAWRTVLTACFAHATPFWRERPLPDRSRFCRLKGNRPQAIFYVARETSSLLLENFDFLGENFYSKLLNMYSVLLNTYSKVLNTYSKVLNKNFYGAKKKFLGLRKNYLRSSEKLSNPCGHAFCSKFNAHTS